jgi:hypothetical protein
MTGVILRDARGRLVKGTASSNPKGRNWPKDPPGTTHRTCRICQIEKPLTDFPFDKKRDLSRKRMCTVCDNKRRNESYHADPEGARWKKILHDYGVTKEQWLAAWEAQERRCACCGTGNPGLGGKKRKNMWQTEHDHVTGKFRGITCHACNRLLGCARDKVEILEAAIRYLERSRC